MVSEQVRHKPSCTSRGWKFGIYKVVEVYYPLSENKGADQLRSSYMKNVGFSPDATHFALIVRLEKPYWEMLRNYS